MKYSLIIGHQLFEKFKDYPKIRVFINDRFIEEFLCDNEESTQLDLYDEKYYEINGECGYGFKQLRLFKSQYLSPKKFTIIDLDPSWWKDHNVLKIEVKGNFSNNTNGFITKRSIVALNPVFLLRTDLLNDKKMMQRIMHYDLKAREHPHLLKRRGQDRLKRWRWPGKTAYTLCMDTNGLAWRTNDFEYSTKGGDFMIDFDIIKKHKTYILKQNTIVQDPHEKISEDAHKIIGIFRIDSFFRAWYQSYIKDKFISRYGASFDREHESVKHMSCEPAHIDTTTTELENKDHIVIHNIKNK
jgi:hypothetical protein